MTRHDLRGVTPEVRDEVLRAVERGWSIGLTARGHPRLVHPSGAIVICSGTTGDRRAVRQLRADLLRVEREAERRAGLAQAAS